MAALDPSVHTSRPPFAYRSTVYDNVPTCDILYFFSSTGPRESKHTLVSLVKQDVDRG